MKLDRVTVTGADDSVSPLDLIAIEKTYPFVEWGILLSKSQEGSARFPSLNWIHDLLKARTGHTKLSGHVCGKWVRDALRDIWSFEKDRPTLKAVFPRIQLNFHAETFTVSPTKLANGLAQFRASQFIFQFDGVNDALRAMAHDAGFNAVPLFDTSGGAGVLPASWPQPFTEYTGYAGGLSPTNVADQLTKIEAKIPHLARIWIDAETHLRTPDNSRLDLRKVQDYLEAARPFVLAGRKR